MRLGELEFIAPSIANEAFSEAAVLGSAVWLWMHSPQHRDWPLHALNNLLLPPVRLRQFVMGSSEGKPCFYMSWANMSAEAESRYIAEPLISLKTEDWNSGPRMWILDWVAPFGQTMQIEELIGRHLFSGACARSMTHRRGRGRRVRFWRGLGVSPAEAAAWRAAHPLVLPTQNAE